jgi:hypothetical protein
VTAGRQASAVVILPGPDRRGPEGTINEHLGHQQADDAGHPNEIRGEPDY